MKWLVTLLPHRVAMIAARRLSEEARNRSGGQDMVPVTHMFSVAHMLRQTPLSCH